MYPVPNPMTKLEKIIRYRLYKEITLRNISLESLSRWFRYWCNYLYMQRIGNSTL